MGKMRLNNMEFYAFHGCLEHEKVRGNRFRVDFECEYDMAAAAQSDSIEDAVNYESIYNLIKGEMGIQANLLEHLAHRILSTIKREFPMLESATVTVTKFNPPVVGQVESSSITLSY